MIAIVTNGSVWAGPLEWQEFLESGALYPLGYTRRDGVLRDPSGGLVAIPQDEPSAPVELPGVRILPVVEVTESTPAGKTQSGRVPVVLAEWVEMRPVWVDAPPSTEALSQPRTMTKYAFRTRVLTFAERVDMDNSTIPELVTMRNDLLVAEVVDLDEVAKYRPVMLGTGLATEARVDEIIAGVTHE